MSLGKNKVRIQHQRESSLLPSIAKKLSLKTEKQAEKNTVTDRYQKFIKDEENNLKRDLEKLHLYSIPNNSLHRKVARHSQEQDQDKVQNESYLKKAKSTPKIQNQTSEKRRVVRQSSQRYMHNEKLSQQLNLPKELDQSLDSSNDEIHKALLHQQQSKYTEPIVYILTKNTQYNLIKQPKQSVYYTEADLSHSKIEIRQNHQSFPIIPNMPIRQHPIHSSPKEQKYIRQKFVGQQAISKFYNRYKNIEKIRELQNFKLQFNPLTVILTILEHYNIPPKRMEVIKLKGEQAILDLKNCGLGSGVSIKAVAEIIEKVKVFQEIDLSYNHINSDLCELIIPNLIRMKRINLSYNKIGRRGMEILSKMVYDEEVDQDCQIEELNLESNYINDTALGNIFTHFVNINSLLILNLSKNYLGNYCASRLKEFLLVDNSLVELYLHWAQLGTKATKAIFQGLAKNHSLKVLDLSWNQIGLDGVRAFCNCNHSHDLVVTTNTTLVHLDISYCEIDEIDTRRMAKALKDNHTIYGLHFQGNLGFIDFKGYLHPIKKQDRYIPVSIRAGLVQRINSINIIKDNHVHGAYESIFLKNICWICEGWEQKYFKVPKQQGQKECFIHFDFEAYNGVVMTDKGNYYQIIRMCPLKPVQFFITKVTHSSQFIHTHIENQTAQVYHFEFGSHIHQFSIQGKKFRQVHIKTMNITSKPRYYSEIFNEDYLTKIQSVPRSDDLNANADLFGKAKQKAEKAKKKKNIKRKQPELIKEIQVKDIPQDFDSLFSKKVGEGEDYQAFLKKCVEFDVSHSKITKIIKNGKELMEVKKILQANYELFQKIYYYLTNNNPNVNGVYSISQNRFQKFIQEQAYESKRVTKAKIRLKLISCLSNQQGQQIQIQGFYRPQFFQFLTRVAMEKWCQIIPKKQNQTEEEKKKRQKYPLSVSQAFSRMIKTLKKYEQKADPLPWRKEHYSSYQVNVVLKSYLPIFEKIYDKYAGSSQKNLNTKTKKKMLLDQFKNLCINSDVRKTKEALKDLEVHYRTAKRLQVQDGISDTGLSFTQFLQTFSRFAQGLSLRPIGSQSHNLWQKEVVPFEQIPLFLKIQKLLKQVYRLNYDIKSKKFDILFENGLFPQQVDVLMTYLKDKYQGGKDLMRRTAMMKNLRINSLQGESGNKITLKLLIDLLKVKAAQIQEENRQRMMKIQEEDQNREQQQNDYD